MFSLFLLVLIPYSFDGLSKLTNDDNNTNTDNKYNRRNDSSDNEVNKTIKWMQSNVKRNANMLKLLRHKTTRKFSQVFQDTGKC